MIFAKYTHIVPKLAFLEIPILQISLPILGQKLSSRTVQFHVFIKLFYIESVFYIVRVYVVFIYYKFNANGK